MTFKSANPAFTNLASKHLLQFIEDYKLFDKDTPLLIAVSGGIDSMVLGYLIYNLKRFGYSNKLRFIYINHNTREGQIRECELVEAFANHLNIEFVSHTLKHLNTERNFEHEAREARYKVMLDDLGTSELLLFAHHINDSYEWSILQGLRSSNLESNIGIPVINQKIRRPLMCFTKSQIVKIANTFDLPFIKDPTNELVKYERNFLRHKIIKSFAQRHPKYLRHYVNRHNELARVLGKHVYLNAVSPFIYRKLENAIELISLSPDLDLSGLDKLILKAARDISPGVRGNLHGQIEKIKMTLKNNKYGPLILSGGLKAYVDFNYVLIVGKNYKLANNFKVSEHTLTLNEFKNYLSIRYPTLIQLVKNDNHFVYSKRKHPLLNGTSEQTILDIKRKIGPTNLLRQWSKLKNQNKVLKLRFFEAT